jgi:hypothetical protein
MAFNVLSSVKIVVSGIVGIGAGKIAKDIITNQINPETLIDKVTTVAGAWAIAGMVADASKNYTDKAIDDVYGYGVKIVDRVKDQQKLNRIDRDESTFEKEGLDPALYRKGAGGKWKPLRLVDDSTDAN